MSALPIPVRFLPNGPLGVGAKTYLSGHILDMFDKELLLNSPTVVSESGLGWDLYRPFTKSIRSRYRYVT